MLYLQGASAVDAQTAQSVGVWYSQHSILQQLLLPLTQHQCLPIFSLLLLLLLLLVLHDAVARPLCCSSMLSS
jgi:hypothetical protein